MQAREDAASHGRKRAAAARAWRGGAHNDIMANNSSKHSMANSSRYSSGGSKTKKKLKKLKKRKKTKNRKKNVKNKSNKEKISKKSLKITKAINKYL